MSQVDGKDFPKGEYWRSLNELEGTPEFDKFLNDEFPEQAAAELKDPVSRRRFMQVMGASFAFAGVASTGCRWEEDYVVPLSRRPEGYLPGVPKTYASSMTMAGVAQPLLITSLDGRPVKVDGNPEAMLGNGSTAFAQASLLSLYDPDRSQRVRAASGNNPAGLLNALKKLSSRLEQTQGRGIAILSQSMASPTLQLLKSDLAGRYRDLTWFEYEAISDDNERDGLRTAFGTPAKLVPDLTNADVILSLGSDFLASPTQTKLATDFASRRRQLSNMNRLYAVESSFTSTGASADHRLPLRAELAVPFLQVLEAKLLKKPVPSEITMLKADPAIDKFATVLAEDLRKAGPRGVIIPGAHLPPEAHNLVAAINAGLGAIGTTAHYYQARDVDRPAYFTSIASLEKQIAQGAIDTLLILGGNPAYDAPADINATFKKRLPIHKLSKADKDAGFKQLTSAFHLSLYDNETSALCTWHIPQAHYLESWGDGYMLDGRVAIQQPIVRPIFDGKTPGDMLYYFLYGDFPPAPHKLIARTFEAATSASFGSSAWKKALHRGFWGDPSAKLTTRPNQPAVILTEGQKSGVKLDKTKLEVVLTSSSHAFDGRFANNGWLQELPDFMTKLTWDNAALVSPRTAKAIGVSQEDRIELTLGETKVEAAVYVMPGQAPYSISLALGHGRQRAGVVGGDKARGVRSSGFDAYPLLRSSTRYIVPGVAISKKGGKYTLASTQDHWDYRDGQGRKGVEGRLSRLIREVEKKDAAQIVPLKKLTSTSTKRLQKEYPNGRNPKVFKGDAIEGRGAKDAHMHVPQDVQQWDGHSYDGNKWGMSIDLTTCAGCNACIVACQAENNIPVVGKDQVSNSREMHWLRIDRYFAGNMENPAVHSQPINCQQCENAPCEQVCPVGATVHSHEGLNDMVYNRCIGTRYCLNNCPYKVRRFNFLDWHKDLDENKNAVKKLLFNPDVTIRSRGVMEKCTWCVQRIQRVKIKYKNEGKVTDSGRRLIPDGEIKTACQDACPTGSIVFGDLNDPNSEVSKKHKSGLAYELLEDLETRPRNRFLARVWNHNSELKGS